MIKKKITNGFVIQTFDDEKNQFVSQSFIASDESDYEDEFGETIEEFDEYLPFEMVQPE